MSTRTYGDLLKAPLPPSGKTDSGDRSASWLSIPQVVGAACLALCLGLSSGAGEAPPGGGKETFVDLPERGENLPAFAGFSFGGGNQKPSPAPKKKAGGKIPVVKLPPDDPIPTELPAGWEWRRNKGRSYAFLLPKEGRTFDIKAGVQDLGDAKMPYIVAHSEITGDITFDMRILSIPVPKGQLLDRTSITEVIRDKYAQDSGGTILSQSDITRGKVPGKEYRIERKDGEVTRLRILTVFRNLYLLSVTGTKKQVDGPTANRIFSSFKHEIMIAAEIKAKAKSAPKK